MLAPGYTDIPEGHIASVTTYLHMREQPSAKPVQAPAGLSVRHFPMPDLAWYRKLFWAVGGNWLWFSRLRMDDGQLAAILHDERVDVLALIQGKQAKGLLELDRRRFPDIELAFFGLTEDLFGRGAGRYLMGVAIEKAWSFQPERFHVHTCTNDHPKALNFYIKSGFSPYRQAVEVAPDPRLTGELPCTAAPHVPLLG
ncbi:MAG: GNAT family N-acetyltransferase [Gemmatimonadaceae bacterium]|nr:GNAT family N-acetyltransferase [Gloeobacterales cyanobacterium ES-bin-141]